MCQQPARVLVPENVRLLLAHVRGQTYSNRNRVMVLLSFKAGLRACEISGLEWPMVLTSAGRIGHQLTIAQGIAKGGHRSEPSFAQVKPQRHYKTNHHLFQPN